MGAHLGSVAELKTKVKVGEVFPESWEGNLFIKNIYILLEFLCSTGVHTT